MSDEITIVLIGGGAPWGWAMRCRRCGLVWLEAERAMHAGTEAREHIEVTHR